ncbi:ribonuclease P protein component [Actinocorallia sp. A-T 12471]|nr:ribonuclease P protein component [Actinocorallia sp. A-T 12471]MDX6742122.1 ribonuclease P protein component [Actinocorallia sp. A-T 12471]
MRRRHEFTLAVRRGYRAGRPRLVAHLLPGGNGEGNSLAGFIVSKAVGNSVVRNRVERRLRHLVRARLDLLPPGSLLVVRANPQAAAAPSDELARDLDRALAKVLRQSGDSRR